MRKELIIINLVICLFCIFFEALSQNKPHFGLSVNHGFSFVSNSKNVVSDEVIGYIEPPSDIRPIGLWQTGSILFDTYWRQKKIILSFGLSSFRYKSVSDSVLPAVGIGLNYGELKETSMIILPTLHFAYRLNIGSQLFYKPSISIGITKVVSRHEIDGVAKQPSGQPAWDEHNRIFSGIYMDFELNAINVELGNSIVYDLNNWSISGGLSYFFYRNLPIRGYHGFHFNVGCSVRFGKHE